MRNLITEKIRYILYAYSNNLWEYIKIFLIIISGSYSSRKAKQLDWKYIEDFWDFNYSQNQ